MKKIKNKNDGKKSLHGIRRNGIRRNGKTPLQKVYISLPYITAARTTGTYRNKEITSLSLSYVCIHLFYDVAQHVLVMPVAVLREDFRPNVSNCWLRWAMGGRDGMALGPRGHDLDSLAESSVRSTNPIHLHL